MIRITHRFTNLPVPHGYTSLQSLMSNEMKSIFVILREYATTNGCTISVSTGDNWRTDILEWPNREQLDSFLTYANTITNYDNLYSEYTTLINSLGASLSKTEEEV
jgi:hypothetical protein